MKYFWIAVVAFLVCDAYLYTENGESYFWGNQHRIERLFKHVALSLGTYHAQEDQEDE
ncbi:hypothetical protein H1O16_gp338 [Burkholderia phage BcepSaruman]|uniref:Uncharacterized protein n=1 Tax=Burkholderia phage BcepSaruman TaxID=2530032 RepID=A0A4D5ZD40_9CAUD|nr:hypothetical protein H1O16_gp338 [Burkholderia phage BcepSaruman]QBX06751.1 hypothetical protein BcepSaruman_338 [Burkholderia phage BcepSaruman]